MAAGRHHAVAAWCRRPLPANLTGAPRPRASECGEQRTEHVGCSMQCNAQRSSCLECVRILLSARKAKCKIQTKKRVSQRSHLKCMACLVDAYCTKTHKRASACGDRCVDAVRCARVYVPLRPPCAAGQRESGEAYTPTRATRAVSEDRARSGPATPPT
eukprot:6840242-Prymnesium_polylepis.1